MLDHILNQKIKLSSVMSLLSSKHNSRLNK